MKVISVINYKGGVGKTTLTANLGAYAASKGNRVLLIDLDPQTQLTFNFITPEDWARLYMKTKTLRGFFEPVILSQQNPKPLSELIIKTRAGTHNLDLICSHLDLIDIDMELAAMIPAPTPRMLASNSLRVFSYLRIALQELKDKYDIVLMDCPPNFYVIVKNALLASDYYIVPSKLDYLSTLGVENLQRNIRNFLLQYDDYMKELQDRRYMPVFLTMLGVVPMMVNYLKGNELIAANEKYINYFRSKNYYLFPNVRNSSAVFAPAPADRVPIVLRKPNFFQSTQKKVLDELKKLGNEFLSRIKVI